MILSDGTNLPSALSRDPTQPTAPYPGPAIPEKSPPAPTQGHGWIDTTPLPNERIGLGQIIEVLPSLTSPLRFSVRQDFVNTGSTLMARLVVVDTETGKEIRLGDDTGSSTFEARTDEYIVWQRGCSTCKNPSQQNGLYAYVLATGKQILITHAGSGATISGPWAGYVRDEGVQNHRGLHVYNLITGEDVLITRALASFPAKSATELYAINEETIAWVDYDPVTAEINIKVYDLIQRTGYPLKIPNPREPVYISVSHDLVLWRETLLQENYRLRPVWQGYDLRQDEVFSISLIPPGVRNLQVQNAGHVSAVGDFVYWFLEINGQTRHFVARVALRGGNNSVATPEKIPTANMSYELILPTVAPAILVTPPAVGVPTSYP